jgi:hypothetical protein
VKNRGDMLLCLLSLLLLFSSANTACADDVDDLLKKCDIAPNPKPAVMVFDYKLSPETLMPGDEGVLTITLKNMHDKPIEKDIDIKRDIKGTSGYAVDIDTTTQFTMDAYIKEAYIDEHEIKVDNKYTSAGVIGPNERVDFSFKIKAPSKEGIYMLKFVADVEDLQGKSSKDIRYFIPIIVTGTVTILPLEVSENEVRLEVINEGPADVSSVYVVATVSDASEGICQPERMYIGTLKAGESTIAVFEMDSTEEGEITALFKALFKHGINQHESEHVDIIVPPAKAYLNEHESPVEGQFENAQTPTLKPTPLPSSSLNSHSAVGIPGLEAIFAVAGLLGAAATKARKRKQLNDSIDTQLP